MPDYEFHTRWMLRASPPAVWHALQHIEEWPLWWPGLADVKQLRTGDGDGLDGQWLCVWRGRLPYRLLLLIHVTRLERERLIEGSVGGGLHGRGLWRLQPMTNGGTQVDFDWLVSGPRPWMRMLAPLVRPLFRWNHDALMESGHQGLVRHLAIDAIEDTR